MKDLKEKLISEHIVFDKRSKEDSLLKRMRDEAMATFEEKGFPTTKNEEWKYTSLRNVLAEDFQITVNSDDEELSYGQLKKYMIHNIDSYKIVFINGVYSSHFSTTTHDEADVCVLSSAMRQGKYQVVLENFYNKLVKGEEEMASLNTAYAKDGAYIYIPDNVILSQPIQILYFYTGDQVQFSNPRNLIVLGNNTQVKIIERHQTLNGKANFTNAVTEIYVGKNSHLDYYKIQDDDLAASLVDSTFVEQERDSVASIQTYSTGGKLTRNGLNFIQNGENCNSVMNGITLGDGDQLIDHHTFMEHKFPNCESHELYRTILDGYAKGIFNGKVLVDPDAQKIDAFQQNNNVLLSADANVYSKPQLEIFADDVKCSHGCTIGQLDHDAMFYLKSRGIPEKKAKALLLYAFMADVTESITIPELKVYITDIITNKLGVELDF
ncbi:Fe-S cluster assembly protein SufD [Flavobacteriaceae bacterium Ap0902]|nr:Fe-S cluster assembly protein SufD [Flavobacteriaceae bacterium Ap0902]